MNGFNEIVDRAIEYVELLRLYMPGYVPSAMTGLRELRDFLAQQSPNDPALARLDAYLASKAGNADVSAP